MKPKSKQREEPIVYVGPPGTCATCILGDVDCRDYGDFDCQDQLADSEEDTGEEGDTVSPSA